MTVAVRIRASALRKSHSGVLGSIGSVREATAEGFVDSFTTELIADRVWHIRS